MGTIKVALAVESHPAHADAFGAYHWKFSAECLGRLAEQAVGLPVTINFTGPPVGCVVGAKQTGECVTLEIDASEDLAQRIASPVFVASADEWSGDYAERVIHKADLKGIGMTDS